MSAPATTGLRILGIDPGSRLTGYGVIEGVGQGLRYLGSGCIRTHTGDAFSRLGEIYAGVMALIAEFQPHAMSIEQVFMARNPSSALKLGQARGVALAAAVANSLPISEYAPRAVKLAVTGTGGASKAQVQHMVTRLLHLQQVPSSDAADALALAICHSHAIVAGQRLGKSS